MNQAKAFEMHKYQLTCYMLKSGATFHRISHGFYSFKNAVGVLVRSGLNSEESLTIMKEQLELIRAISAGEPIVTEG